MRFVVPQPVDPQTRTTAMRMLTVEQLEAFLQLPRFDQHHLICVFESLHSAGHRDPNLLTAALLHDIGKHRNGRSVRFTDRVLKVVLNWLSPPLLRRLATSSPGGRAGGLSLAIHHPQIGAERARELGCSELTCSLIRHHEDRDAAGSELLAALQKADSAC